MTGREDGGRLGRLGVLAPAALSACMDASVLAVPAAGAIVSTVLKELSKAFMLKKWFHGSLTARETEQLMMEKGKNGSFLVRESRGSPGDFVLSVRVRGRVSHVVIRKQHNKYNVGSGEQFDDLVGLIEYFRNYPMIETSGDVLRLLQPLSGTRLCASDIEHRVQQIKRNREVNESQEKIRGFREEFDSLQLLHSLNQFTSAEGRRLENAIKNRYRNILPYDQTRVSLRKKPLAPGADYINASYIRPVAQFNDSVSSVKSSNESINSVHSLKEETKRPHPPLLVTSSLSDDSLTDLKRCIRLDKINGNSHTGMVGEKTYIATQGCLPNTKNDFWHMVWQDDVRVIVMITKEFEKGKNKCERYWPELGEDEDYDELIVTLLSESQNADYILRELSVKNIHNCTRIMYQYQFTGWPDHGTPPEPAGVLRFILDINKRLKSIMLNKDKPDQTVLCVHCSAGVGRTGTFIVIDMILDKIQDLGFNCDIDIFSTVKLARAQRAGMVQNEAQYRFIYLAVHNYLHGMRLKYNVKALSSAV